MNVANIVGRLGQDPEVRYANSGTAIAELRVATNERKKVGDEWQDATEWHTVVVFGRRAETCGEHLDKGSQVGVTGRLETRSWEKDGVTHYRTQIIAESVEFLGSKKDRQQERPAKGGGGGPSDEDLAF